MLARIALWLAKRLIVARRTPDLVIGGTDNPYLLRWHVWPRNRACNLYLHRILRDDDDRALHDHPWANASWILEGGYFEHLPAEDAPARFRARGIPQLVRRTIWRHPGSLLVRLRATQAHRLALARVSSAVAASGVGGAAARGDQQSVPAWTLFLTGPTMRTWGFHCPRGWVDWRRFTAGPRGETVGAGCEQDWDALQAHNDNQVARLRKSGAA